MTVHGVEQRSPEWFALRLGRVTSSRVGDALAVRRDGKPTTGRANLRTALVLERITGESQEKTYENDHMRRGRELEAEAIAQLEAKTGHLVEPVGFVTHDELMVGASPDGRLADGRLVELKCQIPALHLDVLRTKQPPRQFRAQMLHERWVCEAPGVVYVSYCPAFPEGLELVVLEVGEAEDAIQRHVYQVAEFLVEVDQEEQEVREMMEACRG